MNIELPQQSLRSIFIKPKFILAFAGLLGVLLLISAILEIRSGRRELLHILREQASVLMSSLQKSSINAILAFDSLEDELAERLLDNARLIDRLDYSNRLNPAKLQAIAGENRMQRISIVNANGLVELDVEVANHAAETDKIAQASPQIRQFLAGDAQEQVIGLQQDQSNQRNHFMVTRRRRSGGAIVISINANELIDLQRAIGVGRLIQNIGKNESIEYVLLQDEEGIILASENIVSMTSILNDEFLSKALQKNERKSRITIFAERDVFEIVEPFVLDGESFGLFRIGLNMTHVHEANQRALLRIGLVSAVLLVLGVIVVNFVVANQNYALVKDAYRRIQTYTGDMLQNMADAVIAISDKGNITVFNRAAEKLFEISAEQAVGKACSDVTDEIPTRLFEALHTGESITNEECEILVNGQKRIVSLSISVLHDRQGHIDTAFALIKDLTEQKALEEQARRQDKLTAMGELASGVAHEVRNPLNAIAVITQRFQKEFKPKQDEEEYRHLTETVAHEIRRINDIVQQFLQFARPPKLNLTDADFCQVVDAASTLLKSEAKDKGVSFELRLHKVPPLKLDVNQMTQALHNLLRNAFQATESGGIIAVTCGIDKAEVFVTISDTGCGIPAQNLSKIFNLYFTTREHGTGLGLSIVHQIVSQHRGSINVESKEGKGSTFIIRLPISLTY